MQERGVGDKDELKHDFGVDSVHVMHCNELFESHSDEEEVDLRDIGDD